jgi:nucleotide-binding universal stress UspA family protein
MKKILVPIDFSSDSINALEHAINIANKSNASLTMVYVKSNNTLSTPLYFKDLTKKEQHSPEELFNIIIEKYKDKFLTNYDYKIHEGKVFKEITNQAKYDNTDLIVMGTHGMSGFETYFIGSNAFKVVSNVNCDVITVRNGFLRTDIKNIIMPIDISSETQKKLESTVKIAKLYNAKIHVLSVSETNSDEIAKTLESTSSKICNYLSTNNILFERQSILKKGITENIINYANKTKAELISIMTEQTETSYNLWLGKYAQQMINNSPIPILSIHNNK